MCFKLGCDLNMVPEAISKNLEPMLLVEFILQVKHYGIAPYVAIVRPC